jgi:CarD family transcriptional regulator
MFEKGDYIVYGTTGVCQIEDITTMDPLQTGSGRLFYVLVPSSQKGGKIFTPTDSTKNYMRKVLNHDEAEQLIRTSKNCGLPMKSNERISIKPV